MTPQPRLRVPIFVLGLSIVAAACSSSPTVTPTETGATGTTAATGPTAATGATGAATGATGTTGEAVAPDACVLLTEADAVGALGVPVEHVADPIGEGLITGEPDSFESVCYFRPVSSEAQSLVSLVVIRQGTNTEAEIEREIETGGSALEGLGDEAYVVSEQAVVVRAGSVLFVAFVIAVDGSPDPGGAQAVAQAAVERI